MMSVHSAQVSENVSDVCGAPDAGTGSCGGQFLPQVAYRMIKG